jgi:hypothetical protein
MLVTFDFDRPWIRDTESRLVITQGGMSIRQVPVICPVIVVELDVSIRDTVSYHVSGAPADSQYVYGHVPCRFSTEDCTIVVTYTPERDV